MDREDVRDKLQSVIEIRTGHREWDEFWPVVKRIIEMDPLTGQVVMTGGVVAHNSIVVDLVSETLGHEVLVPEHAQFTGALGAALIGREM